jgi:hypothetical protein
MNHALLQHSEVSKPITGGQRAVRWRAMRFLRGAAGVLAIFSVACETTTDPSLGSSSLEVVSHAGASGPLTPCPELQTQESSTPKALSLSSGCDSNPCNPYCRSYSESLDGGLMNTMGAGPAGSWNQAALDDMPMGLVNKGLEEPCVTGSDCQFNSQCAGPITEDCSHDKCVTGEALTGGCDPCVDEVCTLIPECCAEGWNEACIEAMQQTCDVACDQIGDAQCVPWVPGEQDTRCDGVDLSVAPVCDDVIPVCNHGTETAPAGVRIVHFPGNSQQYPEPAPDQGHPQMRECFTSEPILPGTCIEVRGCPNLNGNREVMVNPPDPSGATESRHVPECSARDNWSLRANNVDCHPSACEVEEVTTAYRGACRFKFPGKGGRSPTRSKLRIKRGSTTEEALLDVVPDASSCGARNWYVEDDADGLALRLCPDTCAELREGVDTTLIADLACPGSGFEMASHSETYAPDCGPDHQIQWGYLTYDFSTPDDSKVEVRIRAAETQEELTQAPWQLVATASRALGTETCTPLSLAPCPLDLYELLGGVPNAHAKHVEIMNTALPSSDGASTPTIHSWDLSYSCLPEF